MRRRDETYPDNGFEAWGGYMQAKIAKLDEQFFRKAEGEPKLTNLFNGISIYVNGFTVPSADELKDLMAKHGGVYHIYQKNEDFIIASNLPDTKVKNMSLAKVVKPEWITDSIACNKLLDFKDYLLYRNSRTQRQISFPKNENTNQSSITKDSSLLQDSGTSNITPNPVKTATDPNFISDFYNNSRLHHISQLGACFKQYINDLRDSNNFKFPARNELQNKIQQLSTTNTHLHFEKGKIIMHIDMDCFFVSVGLRSRPDLRGKPVAVTHSKGRQVNPKRPGVDRNTEFNLYRRKYAKKYSKNGEEVNYESRVDNIDDEGEQFGSMSEIASCSYEARSKGISNGMFMGAALKLCPDLQTLPYDFEGYKEVAYTLYDTVAQYTLDIEAVSCDEMYVDCTKILVDTKVSVQDFATILRAEIKEKTGCPCSTGFGGNRLQARLATKKAKPDGQFFLTADLVSNFMTEIKLRDLPGVGRQTAQKLESLGHLTCGTLQSVPLVSLQRHLGNKSGAQLFEQCRGQDSNPLSYHTVRKSVSAEVNYGIRFENVNQCFTFLNQLSSEVQTRMQQLHVIGKCITLKLMVRNEEAPVETAKFMGHGFCNIINKSISLAKATNDAEVIAKEIISIIKKIKIDPKEMRGIGIQITKLENITAKESKGAINKFFTAGKYCKEKSENKEHKNLVQLDHNAYVNVTKTNTFASPKKVVNTSPTKQKSPILGLTKSPAKRRGRLRKINQSASSSVMTKFLQGQSLSFKDIPYKDPMIKKEEECKQVHIKKEEQGKALALIGLPWQKVRELLRAWFESEQIPLPCDVNMICEYIRTMVVNREIDNLVILLNFIKRRTSEINVGTWTEVNKHITEQVQDAMMAVYGKQLHID